jgi:hypothetical protein
MSTIEELIKEYDELSNLSEAQKLSNEFVFGKIAYFDEKYGALKEHNECFESLLSNIGSDQRSIPILNCVLKRIEKKKDTLEQNKFNYDFGNTLFYKASIEFNLAEYLQSLIKCETYRESRKFFSKVNKDKSDHHERANTNIAIILEYYGRNYEAIKAYDKILKYRPMFGMALGGKAISILSYIKMAPQLSLRLANTARELLTEALKDKKIHSIGGPKSYQFFKDRFDHLENSLSENKYKSFNRDLPKSTSIYEKFILNNDLYLNYDFGYYYDKFSLKDTFFPSFIEKIDEKPFDKSGVMSEKIYYSFQVFNQILEDFITCRYSFFQTEILKHKKIDSKVNYVYTYDYTMHSLKYGLYKSIFSSLYNILDKIAHLAKFYFSDTLSSFTDTKIYFEWFTKGEFKNIIINYSSLQLLALHSLALDFKSNNIYYHLSQIRNRVTHSFINVNVDIAYNPKYSDFEITEETFKKIISELFIIVKSALLYLIVAINSTGNRENTGHLDATMQRYIFK